MDPDAALEYIRDCVRRREAAIERGDDDAALDFACEAADAFGELDGWITRGGFLPAAWQR